jgi:hypothetical protein
VLSRGTAERAARLRANGIQTVTGHRGATAGTVTSPTGLLIDLANKGSGVAVVMGDHTDGQVFPSGRTVDRQSTLINRSLLIDSSSTALYGPYKLGPQ